MNDEFFTKFRQSPPPEFVKSLFVRLTQETNSHPFPPQTFMKRLVLALMALCLAFALAMLISPDVRAAVSDLLAKITVKGTTIFVSDDVPAVVEESETYAEIWTPMSPDEILANYPFFAELPTWVPAGYTLQERAAIYSGGMNTDVPSSVLFEWKNKKGELIQLNIQKGSCPDGPTYDSGASRSDCTHQAFFSVGLETQPQVIEVNDQPAVLFYDFLFLRDVSGSVREWNPTRYKFNNHDPEALFLRWEADGRTFEIAVKSRTISRRALIRLAESIP